MTDVLIAGGGIAGSALAILLGRAGLRVELFERSCFPREKPCGEGLMPAGVAVLQRMGIAEAAGGAPFFGVRYHCDGQTLPAKFPAPNGQPGAGFGQRRLVLDRVLFREAAETGGVTAREGAAVDGPLWERGRVAGLIVQGREHRAGLVVAADGVHSRLRRQLGLERLVCRKRFGVRTHFRLRNGLSHPEWVDVFFGDRCELYVTPLPEGEVLVAALARTPPPRLPIAQVFERWWRAEPFLAAELEGATQLTPLQGVSPLAARSRAGFLPGCVLLGDAAGFLDPITGGGMAQALLSAELLASHLAGPATEGSWLPEFDRQRRRMLRDYRLLTGMLLWLSERPQLARRTLGALRRFPRMASHFIGVAGGLNGLLPLSTSGLWSGKTHFAGSDVFRSS